MRPIAPIVLVLVLIAAPIVAGPAAPTVVNGNATFQQSGQDWTITTGSTRTVINWQQFGIDQGATVNFVQPSATSSVLNRVTGAHGSYINGLLTSNGGIYLINPHGIIIGRHGVIRVADFFASTLPLTDAEFLAGTDMHLKGISEAAIENWGKIEAIGGDIHLIARKIVNEGTLTAASGSVNLVAGMDILLTQDDGIFVRPDLSATSGGIGIDNSGVIEAVTARLLANGNMYALAINNTGVVRATGSSVVAGRVVLRAEGGSLVNTGSLAARTVREDGTSVGGEIRVFADDVAITEGAVIDASGDAGGGFIETSGHSLTIDGASITAGLGGTWLIDPTNVVIDAAAAASIVLALDAGTNVDVITPGAGLDAGDIFVNAPIIKTTGTGTPRLLLGAYNGVWINADIDVGPGSLWLIALGAGVTQAPGTSVMATQLYLRGAGAFDLSQPGNDFETIGVQVVGDVAIQDATDLVIGNVGDNHGVSAWGGRVDITTPSGHIFANGLFDTPVVVGYHSIGDVEIIETSWQSQSYQIQLTNGTYSRPAVISPPSVIESFLSLQPGALSGLDPQTTEGSAVLIEFDPGIAGDSLGYGWNYKTRESFEIGFGKNDYSFVVVAPAGAATPDLLADVEDVAAAAKQDSGLFSWQTGLADVGQELNHVDPYTLSFGVMDVEHTLYMSGLYLTDIRFTGHPIPPVIDWLRIFDHVEDFAHLRPDPRVRGIGPGPLGPTLDETSTYFDESSQATDHRYYYQSVGSIYQIPR